MDVHALGSRAAIVRAHANAVAYFATELEHGLVSSLRVRDCPVLAQVRSWQRIPKPQASLRSAFAVPAMADSLRRRLSVRSQRLAASRSSLTVQASGGWVSLTFASPMHTAVAPSASALKMCTVWTESSCVISPVYHDRTVHFTLRQPSPLPSSSPRFNRRPYLAANQPAQAAAEFQRILDHRSIVLVDPVDAMACLQLGERSRSRARPLKAKRAYEDLLTLWKDADPWDPDNQRSARAEYARLPQASPSILCSLDSDLSSPHVRAEDRTDEVGADISIPAPGRHSRTGAHTSRISKTSPHVLDHHHVR